jgi:hypothetical protein
MPAIFEGAPSRGWPGGYGKDYLFGLITKFGLEDNVEWLAPFRAKYNKYRREREIDRQPAHYQGLGLQSLRL